MFLRVVSVPIEVDWFIGTKNSSEFVSESFRVFPPFPNNVLVKKFPYGCYKNGSNKIVSSFMTRKEWEATAEMLSNQNPEGFSDLTELLEKNW